MQPENNYALHIEIVEYIKVIIVAIIIATGSPPGTPLSWVPRTFTATLNVSAFLHCPILSLLELLIPPHPPNPSYSVVEALTLHRCHLPDVIFMPDVPQPPPLDLRTLHHPTLQSTTRVFKGMRG